MLPQYSTYNKGITEEYALRVIILGCNSQYTTAAPILEISEAVGEWFCAERCN
jgi:hypothetical protein